MRTASERRGRLDANGERVCTYALSPRTRHTRARALALVAVSLQQRARMTVNKARRRQSTARAFSCLSTSRNRLAVETPPFSHTSSDFTPGTNVLVVPHHVD